MGSFQGFHSAPRSSSVSHSRSRVSSRRSYRPRSIGPKWIDQQKPATAGVVCLPELDCFVSGGDEVYFLFDGLDGTVDMGKTTGVLPTPGACAIDEITYELRMGPCDFAAEAGGVPSTAAVR